LDILAEEGSTYYILFGGSTEGNVPKLEGLFSGGVGIPVVAELT
jgi:hypothetical protein